ncbi:hypothetical protein RB595_004783 [Gaeumannomyces hyphopodioides]
MAADALSRLKFVPAALPAASAAQMGHVHGYIYHLGHCFLSYSAKVLVAAQEGPQSIPNFRSSPPAFALSNHPDPPVTMASVSGGVRPKRLLCLLLVASLFRVSLCQSYVHTWRIGSSVAVLKNTLYIIGGYTSGKQLDQQSPWLVDNRVSAIPMDKSWSTGDRFIRSKEYQRLGVHFISMWPSPDETEIYTWGGRDVPVSSSFSKEPSLQTFKPHLVDGGDGGGTWTTDGQAPQDSTTSPPRRIYRGTDGSWTSCNGLGFYMGGVVFNSTDLTWPYGNTDNDYGVAMGGLAIYDMNNQKWTNQSVEGFGSDELKGVYISGTAVCLPTLGTKGKGVLLFLGGNQGAQLLSMKDIFLFDIGSGKFHQQRTTATGNDIPQPRNFACAVAAKSSKSKNYEVILFGGADQNPAQPMS